MRDGRFEVRSSVSDAAAADVTVHSSGGLSHSDKWEGTRHSWERSRCFVRAAVVGALYDGFDAVGLQYAPGYRTLARVQGGVGWAAARLGTRAAQEGVVVQPADLDDALCASALVGASGGVEEGATRLPFAVGSALLCGLVGELWAVSRPAVGWLVRRP